jgi:hypothetical protein
MPSLGISDDRTLILGGARRFVQTSRQKLRSCSFDCMHVQRQDGAAAKPRIRHREGRWIGASHSVTGEHCRRVLTTLMALLSLNCQAASPTDVAIFNGGDIGAADSPSTLADDRPSRRTAWLNTCVAGSMLAFLAQQASSSAFPSSTSPQLQGRRIPPVHDANCPHLRRDWARPSRICTGTGLAAAPLPHLHRDWADSPQQSSLGPRRGGSGPIEG